MTNNGVEFEYQLNLHQIAKKCFVKTSRHKCKSRAHLYSVDHGNAKKQWTHKETYTHKELSVKHESHSLHVPNVKVNIMYKNLRSQTHWRSD